MIRATKFTVESLSLSEIVMRIRVRALMGTKAHANPEPSNNNIASLPLCLSLEKNVKMD